MQATMQALVYFLFLALGLFQIAATIAGIEHWFGLHWFFAAIIALFIAWTPVIGTVIGAAGAHYAWGWSWLSAILLFFGPLILMVAIVLAAGAFDETMANL